LSSRRGGSSIGVSQTLPPAAARPQIGKASMSAFEWRGRTIRTATPAPVQTGLTLTGMRRLDRSLRHSLMQWFQRNWDTGFSDAHYDVLRVIQRFAAAWEPSARSFTPIILSAIKQANRRVVPPETISSGGDDLLQAREPRTSLCSLRTATRQQKIHDLFAGTQNTLSGAADADTKTGAAIRVKAAPREPV